MSLKDLGEESTKTNLGFVYESSFLLERLLWLRIGQVTGCSVPERFLGEFN